MSDQGGTAWGAVIVVAAVAVGLGSAVTLQMAGRDVVVSWVDAAAVGVFGTGLLWRRRTASNLRTDDAAVVLYAALVAYLAFQVLVPFVGQAMDLEIATGASRFAGPLVLLVGLAWLRASLVDGRWPWRQALVALGLLICLGIARDVVSAAGDGLGFYDWKRAIQQELGVSNILAAYTAIAFWAAASLVPTDRRWAAPAIVLFVATGLTLSRAAALGMLVAVVLVAVGARWGARLAIVGLVAVTLALTAVPIAMDTEAGADDAVGSALRVRDEQFTAAWEAWQDQPLFGVGLNRFEEDVTVVTSQPSAAAVDGVIPYEHPNNAWLVALAELGLVGALLYLGIWVLLGRRVLALADPWERAGAAAGLAGLAVHAQLEALTFTRGIEFLLALLLGAIAVTGPGIPAESEPAGGV